MKMLTPEEKAKIIELAMQGCTFSEIGRTIGRPVSAISRYCRLNEIARRRNRLRSAPATRPAVVLNVGDAVNIRARGEWNRVEKYAARVVAVTQNGFAIDRGLYREFWQWVDITIGRIRVKVA